MGAMLENATVTGLEPGTTYHYRLVASSTGGTVYGSDKAFTTIRAGGTDVLREAAFGSQWVFYVGSNGEVCWWGTSAPKWEYTNYCPGGGQAAEQGTTPSAVMNENGTLQWIYYTGSNNEICSWGASAPKWEYTNYCPGGGNKTASGTNPAAVRETSGGTQWIYYVGGNGKVCWWGTSAPKWEFTNYCPGGGQAAF